MQKILVPTDFSDNAAKAAIYAAEIAKRSGGTIYFLYAMEAGATEIVLPSSVVEQQFMDEKEAAMKQLEIFRKSVTNVYPGIKTEVILDEGMPTEAARYACKLYDISLIVMGTRGAGYLRSKLIGTNAADVVASSTVPVLVVPEEYVMEEPDKILFATNTFEKDIRLLQPVMDFAAIFSAAVHAVVFVDTDKATAVDYLDGQRNMENYLRFLQKTFPSHTFKGELIEGREFEHAIELYHAVNDTDLAAMITWPRGFWERIFQKSVTKKMVYHSTVPVLAIPAT